MPPKAAPAGPNKKSQEKEKKKIIEDKTFGLKNKKGAKQQKFIQQVQKQVQNKMAPKNPRDMVIDFVVKINIKLINLRINIFLSNNKDGGSK